MEKIKVMSVFGTRPEAIKRAPLIKELEKTPGIESIVCVTAQHREMLDQVLEIFSIRPQYDLNIMQSRQTLAGITTRALTGLEDAISNEKPDLVLVHGDTSTTFAGALAAYYSRVKVGHVEAGLRTYNKLEPFPEEMNRRLTGALADLHFAPTPLAKEHLRRENIPEDGIFITGNTVIDALAHTVEPDYVFSEGTLNAIDFQNKRVLAVTAHRRENLGEPLANICRALLRLADGFPDVDVVYAVHKNPAVWEPVHELLGNHPRIHLTGPLNLKDMHNLMSRSYLVLTDSGGLQEEVPSMGKPVLVLRNVTERPEGLEAGTLKLAGTEEETVFRMAKELLEDKAAYAKMAETRNPFGDGQASRRIVQSILFSFGKRDSRPEEFRYSTRHDNPKKEENTMKEERMAILNMLEKGIISVDEADRLLNTLHSGMGMEKDGIGKAVGGALEKAGAALGSVAKTVGEKAQPVVKTVSEKAQPVVKSAAEKVSDKAEDLQPKVRNAAFRMTEKVSEKAEEMQPKMRSAAFRMNEKAHAFKEDMAAYREKLKEKRNRDAEEDWDDIDMEEMDLEETAEQPAETEADPEVEGYLKGVENVLDAVQTQMEQIDEAENFLKSAFGDVDPGEWEDDEEEAPKEEKAEEEKPEE